MPVKKLKGRRLVYLLRLKFFFLLLIVIFLVPRSPLYGEDTVGGWVHYYQSDSGVKDYSPSFSVSKDVSDQTSLELSYQADVVTAASWDYKNSKTHQGYFPTYGSTCNDCHNPKDGLTGASTNFWEKRQAVTMGVKHNIDESQLQAAYNYSGENDFRSNAVSLGGLQNFFDRNTTVSFVFTGVGDAIFARYKSFTDSASTYTYDFSVSQILTKTLTSRAIFSYSDQYGFLSDPYHIIIVGTGLGAPTIPYPEAHPDYKSHGAVSLLLNQYLFEEAALNMDYRYYQDNWAVQSNTVGITYRQAVLPNLIISPEWRYYVQTGASFFKNFYYVPETYMTRDLKLAPFSSQQWGIDLLYPFMDHWDVDLKYSEYRQASALDYSWYFANRDIFAQMVQMGVNFK